MKYAITSAIYIFGVIMGLTVLVLLLLNAVPMAVFDAVGDNPAKVVGDDTAITALNYAAIASAGLWLTANIQHFVVTRIRAALRPGRGGKRKKDDAETSSA